MILDGREWPAPDYDEIAEAVLPDELARVLGAERRGNGYRCPLADRHKNGDRHPSFSVFRDESRTAAKCHACGLGGSPVSVVAQVRGVPLPEAAEQITRELRIDIGSNGAGKATIETYDYVDESRELLFQTVRLGPKKDFRQRRPDGRGEWIWKLDQTRRVLYRLPEVIEAALLGKTVYVVEGEKDVHAIEAAGGVATCNPMGAGKWRAEYAETLRGAQVRVIADRDEPGVAHARQVAESVEGIAASVELLQAAEGKDAADHLDAGHGLDDFVPLGNDERDDTDDESPVRLDDFVAYMPMHMYVFIPTLETWPASSVNARIAKQGHLNASTWLDRNRPVEQMTWAPGLPMVIEDRLIAGGGWIDRRGVRVLNHYRAPTIELGDPAKAERWLEHVRFVFPGELDHIVRWLAHRVQRPDEKINHALVLIGPQGTGKDTALEGAIPAVGRWNVADVSPDQVLGRFNGFLKSVILRVSEARDLGDTDRYRLYERLKTYTAAPPDALQVDEKHVREYMVPNVSGVVITSNHTDGIYLPPDDRRHFVAVTELTKDDFDSDYWMELYAWYKSGGQGHIAAYLSGLDLADFDPKAPPPKTAGFWQVADAGRAPEDAEIADVLDKHQWPEAITLTQLASRAEPGFRQWLEERRNRRNIPRRMEAVGYAPTRNDAAKDGLWKVDNRRQAIYAKRDLSLRDRTKAAQRLVDAPR